MYPNNIIVGGIVLGEFPIKAILLRRLFFCLVVTLRNAKLRWLTPRCLKVPVSKSVQSAIHYFPPFHLASYSFSFFTQKPWIWWHYFTSNLYLLIDSLSNWFLLSDSNNSFLQQLFYPNKVLEYFFLWGGLVVRLVVYSFLSFWLIYVSFKSF